MTRFTEAETRNEALEETIVNLTHENELLKRRVCGNKTELLRVLYDGRLPLDNTRSERSRRKIVVGRKNWMFYGSDTHAESAAAIFSLIASCRLHHIDLEQ